MYARPLLTENQSKNVVEIVPDIDTPIQAGIRRTWTGEAGTTTSTVTVEGIVQLPIRRQSTSKPVEIQKGITVISQFKPSASPLPRPSVPSSPPKASNAELETALLVAAEEGHADSVKRLLEEKGANVNARGGEFGSALHAAAYQGHVRVIKILLKNGANVKMQAGIFRFALTAAAASSSSDSVRMMTILRDNGAELNARDMENETALHGAVFGNNLEAARFLIEQGVPVDIRGTCNGTALQMALDLEFKDMVRLLLGDKSSESSSPRMAPSTPNLKLNTETDSEAPIDPFVVETLQKLLNMALVGACMEGPIEDVRELLELGASVNSFLDGFGYALQAACFKGQLEIAQLLLDQDADVNLQGGELGNALQAAALSGNTVLTMLLLVWEANVNQICGYYGCALQAAASEGHLAVMDVLLKFGANVNAYGGHYTFPIIAAAASGIEATQKLVAHGASVRVKAAGGYTPVDVARASNHHDAVTYLKSVGGKSSRFFSKSFWAAFMQSAVLSFQEGYQEAEAARIMKEQMMAAGIGSSQPQPDPQSLNQSENGVAT